MVAGYSAEQIRAAEAPHLDAGEPLMRRAAAGLAAEIRRALNAGDAGDAVPDSATTRTRDARAADDAERVPGAEPTPWRILFLVGSGNNGGDALFAAAELAAEGADVTIAATGSRMHEDGLAAAVESGARVEAMHPLSPNRRDRLVRRARSAHMLVDGILGIGTGGSPALRGPAREIVDALLPVVRATLRPLVVAVDIPSGIDPDDGSVPDPAVLPADVTVTFGGVKAGLLLDPAAGLAGTVRLIDIGLGPELDEMDPLV